MFAVIISTYNATPSTVHPIITWFIISNIPCPGSSNHNSISHVDQDASEHVFVDGATVQFCPGDHHLTGSLRLDNVQNLTLQGSPGSNLNIHPWVNITLENCINITISSLIFNFAGDYSYFLIFTHTSFTQLSNVAFYGRILSTVTGCSAVMSTNSTIAVTDSNFTGLHGWLGAAILTTGSNITLTGNTFQNNTANSGGAIYPYESHLYLKGINAFINNTVIPLENNTTILCELKEIEHIIGNGGAMFSYNSTLKIEGDLRFVKNHALDRGSGGAIAAKNSKLTMHNLTCIGNTANDGGAILILYTNLQIFGIAILENNTAWFGGALHISRSELSFSSTLFQNSTILCGNTAIEQGGAIRSFDSVINFASNVVFDGNQADTGGAMTIRQSTTLSLILNSKLYFIENHANTKGGAIHVNDPATCLHLFVNPCFFIVNVSTENTALVFFNNSAKIAGNALFGGQLDRCEYSPTVGSLNCERDIGNSDIEIENLSSPAIDLFKNISMIIPQTPLDISSKAEKIKICNYDCDTICNTFMTNESLDACTEHHNICLSRSQF